MNAKLALSANVILNVAAGLIITVQIAANFFVAISGSIGGSDPNVMKEILWFGLWGIWAMGMSASLPCVYFSFKYVLCSRNPASKAIGVLAAILIPAINWVVISTNYKFAKSFDFPMEYWFWPTSILMVLAIQLVLPLKLNRMLKGKLQYNQSLQPTGFAVG